MNTPNLTQKENRINKDSTPNHGHQNLLQSLSQFGLCPFDWTIDFKNNTHAVIKNNDEADFQFIGKVNSTNKDWEYLKLLSI